MGFSQDLNLHLGLLLHVTVKEYIYFRMLSVFVTGTTLLLLCLEEEWILQNLNTVRHKSDDPLVGLG